MRIFSFKWILVLVLAFSVTACQKNVKPEQQEDPVSEEEVVDETTDETLVDDGSDEQVDVDGVAIDGPLTAANFANASTNYQGGLNVDTVYFAFDSSAIPTEAYAALKAIAQYIASTDDAMVRLEGHGDEQGTREYNMALGERRAQAVEKFLRVNGVQQDKLEVISYGEEKPASSAHDEMAYAENRRVIITYVSGAPAK